MVTTGYERIWVRGLTPLMRQQLIQVAEHEGEQITPVHGGSAKALRNRGYITEYPYRLTDKGRALIAANAGRALVESQNAAQSETAGRAETPDPYDYSALNANELLDIVRKAWQEYDLKEMTDEYCDVGTAVMVELALTAKPADETAALRARVQALEAANADMKRTLTEAGIYIDKLFKLYMQALDPHE